MRILFTASESWPWISTGGLAGAVGGLARALSKAGHDVVLALPLHARVNRSAIGHAIALGVPMGTGTVWCSRREAIFPDGPNVWWIEHDEMFNRSVPYGWKDDMWRYAFLGKAAIQACKDSGWIPDILHAHDWMGASSIVFRKTWDRILSPLASTGCVLTLHNIAYQEKAPKEVLRWMGLGDEHFHPEMLEDHGRVNVLKAACVLADRVTTVSPSHAIEIQTPGGGRGLEPYVGNRGGVRGVLNGLDEEVWNPRTDRHLPASFGPHDLDGRRICRRELRLELGLPPDDPAPLLTLVARLVEEKGIGLLHGLLDHRVWRGDILLAVMGVGDPRHEAWMWSLAQKHPGRVWYRSTYDEGLSHRLFAGGDLYLMPSLFEPCGLAQMQAQKYGQLPLVRAVGGLRDTVWDVSAGGGDGFVFDPPWPGALADTLDRALHTWHQDRPAWDQAVVRAMLHRRAWSDRVPLWEEIYREAIEENARGL